MSALCVPLFFLTFAVIIFAAFIFYLEGEANREGGNAAFHSIPHAIWFMFVTFTTVGFGDVSPNSNIGKTIASIGIIFGILFLSMPLAIVGSNFCEAWEDRQRIVFIEKFKLHFFSKARARGEREAAFRIVGVFTHSRAALLARGGRRPPDRGRATHQQVAAPSPL